MIVPIWKSDEEKAAVCDKARELAALLRPAIGPVHIDDRDNLRPGWKYSEWERKGVPLRLEIGPRDLAQETAMLKARHDRAKNIVPFAEIVAGVQAELDRIQQDLFDRAKQRLVENTHVIDTWDRVHRPVREPGRRLRHGPLVR